AASILVDSLVPIFFMNIGADGTVTMVHAGAGRTDVLVVNGTDNNDRFRVQPTTGAIALNDRVVIFTPGVDSINLSGRAGPDLFALFGPFPSPDLVVNGPGGGVYGVDVFSTTFDPHNITLTLFAPNPITGLGGTIPYAPFTVTAGINITGNGVSDS